MSVADAELIYLHLLFTVCNASMWVTCALSSYCSSMSFSSLSTCFCYSSADLRSALPCVTKETLRVYSLLSYIFSAFSVNWAMSVFNCLQSCCNSDSLFSSAFSFLSLLVLFLFISLHTKVVHVPSPCTSHRCNHCTTDISIPNTLDKINVVFYDSPCYKTFHMLILNYHFFIYRKSFFPPLPVHVITQETY